MNSAGIDLCRPIPLYNHDAMSTKFDNVTNKHLNSCFFFLNFFIKNKGQRFCLIGN